MLHQCQIWRRQLFVNSILFLFFHSISAERSNYIVHMNNSAMPKSFINHPDQWYSSILQCIATKNSTSSPQAIASKASVPVYTPTSLNPIMKSKGSSLLTPTSWSVSTPPILRSISHSTEFLASGHNQTMEKTSLLASLTLVSGQRTQASETVEWALSLQGGKENIKSSIPSLSLPCTTASSLVLYSFTIHILKVE